jgi:hypothetical protein
MADYSPIVGNEPTFTVEVVTPELAKKWLGHNMPNNRHLTPSRVTQYARDMKEGNWKMTGDPVRFDTKGHLVDGQHRLSACVAAQLPFTTVVGRDISHPATYVMDQGKKRSLADALRVDGHMSVSRMATFVSTAYQFDLDGLQDPWNWGETYPTVAESLAWYKANKADVDAVIEAAKSVANGRRLTNKIPASAGLTLGLLALRGGLMDEYLDFLGEVGSDAGHSDGGPIVAYRRWIIEGLSNKVIRNKRTHLAVLIQMFNAYINGTPVSKVRFVPSNHKFPTLTVVR